MEYRYADYKTDCIKHGISIDNFYSRLRLGWSPEKASTTPLAKRRSVRAKRIEPTTIMPSKMYIKELEKELAAVVAKRLNLGKNAPEQTINSLKVQERNYKNTIRSIDTYFYEAMDFYCMNREIAEKRYSKGILEAIKDELASADKDPIISAIYHDYI